MEIVKDADGKVVLRGEDISYLCITGNHKDCGGFKCKCTCHDVIMVR